jgi:hypothetical protein
VVQMLSNLMQKPLHDKDQCPPDQRCGQPREHNTITMTACSRAKVRPASACAASPRALERLTSLCSSASPRTQGACAELPSR